MKNCSTPCIAKDSTRNHDRPISSKLGWVQGDQETTNKLQLNWTTILLGVLAAVFLIALLSVSLSYWTSVRSRKAHSDGTISSRNKEQIDTEETFLSVSVPSISDLNIEAKRRSDRVSQLQESEGISQSPKSYRLVTENLRVKEIPIDKSSTRKSTRDSLLSVTKLIRNKSFLVAKEEAESHSVTGEQLFIESINLEGDGEVIVTSGKNCVKKKIHKSVS